MKILVVAMIAPAQDTKQQEPIVQPFLKPVSWDGGITNADGGGVRKECISKGLEDEDPALVLVAQLVSYHDTRRP